MLERRPANVRKAMKVQPILAPGMVPTAGEKVVFEGSFTLPARSLPQKCFQVPITLIRQ